MHTYIHTHTHTHTYIHTYPYLHKYIQDVADLLEKNKTLMIYLRDSLIITEVPCTH